MKVRQAFSLWQSGVITREQLDDLVDELYREHSNAKTAHEPKDEQAEFQERHEGEREEPSS